MENSLSKTVNGCHVLLKKNDALTEYGDVLINPMGKTMLFGNTEFNKRVLAVSSNAMMLEIIKKNRISPFSNMLTLGHASNFTKIYHARIPNYINGRFKEINLLSDLISECMKILKNNMCKMVIIPHMNAGERIFPNDIFIETIVDSFINNSWEGSIITFCIDDDTLYSTYYTKLEKV